MWKYFKHSGYFVVIVYRNLPFGLGAQCQYGLLTDDDQLIGRHQHWQSGRSPWGQGLHVPVAHPGVIISRNNPLPVENKLCLLSLVVLCDVVRFGHLGGGREVVDDGVHVPHVQYLRRCPRDHRPPITGEEHVEDFTATYLDGSQVRWRIKSTNTKQSDVFYIKNGVVCDILLIPQNAVLCCYGNSPEEMKRATFITDCDQFQTVI